MKLPQKIQIQLSRHEILAIFIVLAVLLWILPIWPQTPQPRITHTLGSSTQDVEVLWFNQNVYTKMTADNNGVVYAMPLSDNLVAIDNGSGTILWHIPLPLERGGRARGIFVDRDTVFVVTTLNAVAYEAKTGELKWSTELGYGHVSIVSQLDAGMLRVYYGEKLFEIDPESGKILTATPKDTVTWVIGNVVLKILPNNELTALDKQTGKSLWTKLDVGNMFDINDGQEPQDISEDILIVGYKDKRICALKLRNGENSWCRSEAYISKVAVDRESQLGYAMRDDFVLVTIDLQTGNVLGETSFLSSEPNKEYFGFVPIVFSNGVVVVSFYDSGQTFGLSIK